MRLIISIKQNSLMYNVQFLALRFVAWFSSLVYEINSTINDLKMIV